MQPGFLARTPIPGQDARQPVKRMEDWIRSESAVVRVDDRLTDRAALAQCTEQLMLLKL